MNLILMIIGQLIVYLLLMLFDEYFGQLLAMIVGAISLAVWAISHIVEWIEPSRVKRDYYQYMLSGWVGPALALALFILLRGGIGWMS
ncbi:hypothetical protein [Lewinella sp. W8]|uniref:hypothetical protein n=1 Tax=Lewinella sp. W8 TaxID=2528208 RepID=UPI0010683E72|nr:hypothetical protein [Lewinella sp. W8]MTB53110.1 hypothetical protein [Lewinella sp. W8]